MESDLFPIMQKEDKGLVVRSGLFPVMQQEDSTPVKMRHQVLSGWIWEMVLAVNGGYLLLSPFIMVSRDTAAFTLYSTRTVKNKLQ